ncbi:MAG: TonB-dependent receptor [Acidobacteria bacterium]|nr:TonB-dependent receptor [Acidobacteriota bacterium]
MKLMLLLAGAAVGLAQSPHGTIAGTISDSLGAVVANVEVVAQETGTGLTFRSKSSENGTYFIPSVPIGGLTVTASAPGFKTFRRQGLTMEVDQRMRLDITLELGAVTETVTVNEELPRIATDDSTVGAIIEQERIEQLPINGRHVFSLVQLVAGVQPLDRDADGFAEITNQGFSQMRVNGGPVYGNQIMLDGGMNTAPVHGEVSVVPLLDSVKEFKVETNGLKAEYGQSSGGVINVVTKSGTNRISGSAYEFVRNDFFDARNFFAVNQDPLSGRYNPMLRYNQYGATVGGPVYIPRLYNGKGKTFFYFGYEQWRYKSGSLNRGTVPTELERNGDFTKSLNGLGQSQPIFDPSTTRPNPNGTGFVRDLFPGSVIPRSRFDPVAVNVLKYMPAANVAPINVFTQTNNYLSLAPSPDDQGVTQVKVDHRLSKKDSFFGRYSRNRNHRGGGGFGLGPADPALFARDDQRDNHNFILSSTHVFSVNLLNEFRANVTRQNLDFRHISADGGWPAKLGLPASLPQDLFPRFDVSGIFSLGATSPTLGTRAQHTIQFTEAMTIIRGRHQIKVGTDQRWVRLNWLQKQYPSGQYTFSAALTSNPQQSAGTGIAMASFLLGTVAGGQIISLPAYSFHSWINGSYVQDDWKVTRRLTLNIGLRYDIASEPVERWNRHSNFLPYVTNKETGYGGVLSYAGVDTPRQFVNRDNNNFGPRFGFGYALTKDGKTAVRGAFGILYLNGLSGNTSGDNSNSLGFSATTPFVAPGGGPFPAFQLSNGPPNIVVPQGVAGGPAAFRGLSVRYQDPNQRTPYQEQWNFTIDRALPGKWTASVSYTGNHGVKLFGGNYDINAMDPQNFALGNILNNTVANPFAGKIPGTSLNNATISRVQSLKPLPDYLTVATFANHGLSSSYHAFQAHVQRRYSNGFSLMVSYTNSKLIDEAASSSGSQGGVDGYRLGKHNRRLERGLDPSDISQRMVISGLYELPFARHATGWQKRVVKGWQLNTINTTQRGDPLEVRGANNFTGINFPNVLYDPTLSGEQRGVLQWFDVAAFRNPADWTVGNVARSLPRTRGPGMFTMNLSLFKTFRFSERVRTEFRAEAFNGLNHTNLLNPNASFSPNREGLSTNPNFGRITTASPARRLQFGLRLSW